MANQQDKLAVVSNSEPIPAQSEMSALIHIIERAARDPSVDIDKLQRLVDMQERIVQRNAATAYAAALSAMQPDLPVIVERGKIDIGRGKPQSYALWEDINETIKPVLAKHGFSLSFRTGQEDGKIIVTGILSHREGHSERTTMHLPTDTSGSKNAVQAVGSSTSYGKRYTAAALLNLTSRGEDDDGIAGGSSGKITQEQLTDLIALADDVGADKQAFCKYFNIASLADIHARDYPRAVAALNKKRAK
jgi:hypothetical protein